MSTGELWLAAPPPRRGAACLLAALLAMQCCALGSAWAARTLLQSPNPRSNGNYDIYFPLVNGSLASEIPANAFHAQGHNILWTDDPAFANVLTCDASSRSYVTLPGVTYGQDGSFALAVWVKAPVGNGSYLEYVLSQNATDNSDAVQSANFVGLYIPQRNNRGFGVVRAIVRDHNDHGTGPTPFYVDSDGCVGDVDCRNRAVADLDWDEQRWHLLGLTTRPQGGRGFQLYVDGRLAADLNDEDQASAAAGIVHPANNHNVTGGDPMYADGLLTLCSRSDQDPERFLSGSLAHLMIWNRSIEASAWKSLYSAAFAQLPEGAPPPGDVWGRPVLDVDPAAYEAQRSPSLFLPRDDVAVPSAEDAMAPGIPPGTTFLGGLPLCASEALPNLQALQSCPQGTICAALRAEEAARLLSLGPLDRSILVGVCAPLLKGLTPTNASETPTPAAFFPLSSPELVSYPLPTHQGQSWGAQVVPDAVFGAALRCRGESPDFAALDVPAYAAKGPFAISLWARAGTPQRGAGTTYLFSHMGANLTGPVQGWAANQIQLYLPASEHPAYGVARALVKDETDGDLGAASRVYLDTDGSVGFSGSRTVASPLQDGRWHMLTISSMSDGSPGYRLFLDGLPAAGISDALPVALEGGAQAHVDGGNPILLGPQLILCTRADNPAEHQFDGRIAHVAVYDRALADADVAAVYRGAAALQLNSTSAAAVPEAAEEAALEVKDQQGGPSDGASLVPRMSTSNRRCIFPALHAGQVVRDCVSLAGGEYCLVALGVWEACLPVPASRSTVDGRLCAFPATWQGETVYDCVAQTEGAAPSCPTAQGTWSVCAPRAGGPAPGAGPSPPWVLRASSGAACAAPLSFEGTTLSGCVAMAGQPWCWARQPDSRGELGPGRWDACAASALGTRPARSGSRDLAVPIVRARTRRTTQGAACTLPLVFEEALLDDCVPRQLVQGSEAQTVPACVDPQGEWHECAALAADAPAEPEAVLVANRSVADGGQSCVLPAAANGRLFFDCVPSAARDEWLRQTLEERGVSPAAPVCPAADGRWQECSALGSLDAVPLDPARQLEARVGAGERGAPCAVAGGTAAQGCLADLICAPLPDLGGAFDAALQNLGECALAPDNLRGWQALLPAPNDALDTSGDAQNSAHVVALPTPLAALPLSDPARVQSLSLPLYSGHARGSPPAQWETDPSFGGVVRCRSADAQSLDVEPVPFASGGAWAVNLWLQRPRGQEPAGESFQYLFSAGPSGGAAPAQPGSIALYLPSSENAAYGLVRAMALDDAQPGGPDAPFLDSDGHVSDGGPRNGTALHAPLHDGLWHMLTLSTLSAGRRGFALFVDGKLVGELAEGSVLPGNGTLAAASAGGPLTLDGPIVLCARTDKAADRFFDGRVAHLALFQNALDEPQVDTLHRRYLRLVDGLDTDVGEDAHDVLGYEGQVGAVDGEGASSSSLGAGAVVGIVVAAVLALVAAAGLAMLLRRRRQNRFQRFEENGDAASGSGEGGEEALKTSGSTSSKFDSSPARFASPPAQARAPTPDPSPAEAHSIQALAGGGTWGATPFVSDALSDDVQYRTPAPGAGVPPRVPVRSNTALRALPSTRAAFRT